MTVCFCKHAPPNNVMERNLAFKRLLANVKFVTFMSKSKIINVSNVESRFHERQLRSSRAPLGARSATQRTRPLPFA